MKTIYIIAVIFVFNDLNTLAQESNIKISAYDGIMVTGYVDYGAYLNFTGPSLNFSYKKSKFIVGMLPSLRFKEDNSVIRNSFVTPSLGVGFTYSYNFIAIQLPLYYTPKTITQNGRWNPGVGIGVRLNKLNNKK